MVFILEEVKETILDFSKRIVKVVYLLASKLKQDKKFNFGLI